MKKYAIIVAGGKGERMNSTTPKQFLDQNGTPIVVTTIQSFLHVQGIQIILVLPKNHIDSWTEIEQRHLSGTLIKTTVGGSTRTDSVRAGLNEISGDGLVAIHDAVRPYVTKELIERSFTSAEAYGSGVAAVELKDSIREIVNEEHSESRDRNNFRAIQTPQTFQVNLIKEAYKKVLGNYSDDATLFEKAGHTVRLVEGEYANIKITTPEDLA